jgi:glycine/D-amino acid oxidase-like deaminating enzyme
MRVLIAGAGVVGACTAYYLARRGVEVVVVERTGIACAASGKSGGFLALDWCDGSPLEPLARRSFRLHETLAAEIGGWGYRKLDTLAVVASARRELGPAPGALPGWLGAGARLQQRLGTPATTAQIEPAAFTRGMLEAAVRRGAELRIGEVGGLVTQGDRVAGALVDGEPVAADAVVIAMGPWSARAAGWLALPAVHGLKGHSVVVRDAGSATAHALFVQAELSDGSVEAPEVFPRPDGTVYVCGLPGEEALPDDPAEVATHDRATARLLETIRTFAPALAEAEIVAAGACYRPVIRDGLPLLGRVPGADGAYVATGHSVWGMLNAPASGEAMAELITEGGARSVGLAPFDPARLRPAAGRW